MDQDAFRETYREINDRACPYEKSILAGSCRCSQAERFCLAEREGVHCRSDEAKQRCQALLDMLRRQARFAIKSPAAGESGLSHAKTMRIQVGGLRGLHTLLEPSAGIPPVIEDIHLLIERAIATFAALEEIPLQPLIQQIAAYQGRRRRIRPD